MKKFKTIDIWISTLLITISIIIGLIERNHTVIACYFIVGGWQIISMLVHGINRWFTEMYGIRYFYHSTVLVIIIVSILGIWVYPLILILLYILLYVAPVMAVFYTWLCYREVYVKMQRPLAMLK